MIVHLLHIGFSAAAVHNEIAQYDIQHSKEKHACRGGENLSHSADEKPEYHHAGAHEHGKEAVEFGPHVVRNIVLHTALPQGGAVEAVQCDPCGFVLLQAGSNQCTKGEYAAALRLLERAWQQSAEEANLRLMILAKTMLGNTYSELQDWQQMDRCYQAALRMLEEVNQPWTEEYISSIHYNVGATLLERQQYAQGWQQLSQCTRQDGLHCHKMAVAAEALGRTAEALDWIERGMKYCEESSYDFCLRQRLELVRFRLEHPDYLQSDAYESMLMDCFYTLQRKGLQGHARFELVWLIRFLQHRRRYKELAELLLQFSSIDSPMTV